MKVGFVGLGKLGLPVAVALNSLGHEVIGFDLDAKRMTKTSHGYIEAGDPLAPTFTEALQKSKLKFWPFGDLVCNADVIMIAVQTPHEELYDGTHPLPHTRVDFDYRHLREALNGICAAAVAVTRSRPLGIFVISTVLPGTLRRLMAGIDVPACCHVVYNPSYIAMGTTLRDFLDPEFILIGHLDRDADRTSKALVCRHLARELYEPLQQACHTRRTGQPAAYYRHGDARPPIIEMGCESAELSKVAYNTAISAKLAVANALMELCSKTPGTNIDDVSRVLMAAYRRVSSDQYWRGGMGDGGACHPRDNIAMSWLAREKHLGFDIFEAVMMARERQAVWFAKEIIKAAKRITEGRQARVLILGYAYKPGSNITTGSHALLVAEILRDAEWMTLELRDPMIEPGKTIELHGYDVVFIGCAHDGIADQWFPESTVVIDPFRIITRDKARKLISLGVGAYV